MTNEAAQELDYGINMAVKGLIEAMGMFAENQQRLSNKESVAYDHKAFMDIIDENGLHHNAVLTRWEGKNYG